MSWIFDTVDRSGRKIHLSKERWSHINKEHPELAAHLEDIKGTLKSPNKFVMPGFDGSIRYFYKYLKNRQSRARYLLVIVKYLNAHGFIITSYFVRNIR